MSTKKTLMKNTTWLFASNVFTNILGFFVIVFIARFLGDVKLGVYSFALAFVSIFISMSDMGVRTLMTREVARDKSKSSVFFGNVLGFKLVANSIAMLIPIFLIFFMNRDAVTIKIVIIFGLAMFFDCFTLAYRSIFEAYEKMEYEAIARMIVKFIVFSIGGLLFYRGYGLVAFALVLLLAEIIYLCILSYIYKIKVETPKLRFDFKFWKTIIKKSLPFWFTFIFFKIYFQISNIMLPLMKDYQVTGWYNAAFKLVEGLYFIPFVVTVVVFPVMSRFYVDNKPYLKLLYERSFKYLFMIGFPIGVGTLILAQRLILFIYKKEFIESSIVLQILIWAVVFMFVNYLIGTFLNSINKQKQFTYSTGVCVIINIVLNLILIPKFSYIGVSLSLVITEVINFVILYYFSSKNKFKIPLFKLTFKTIIAGLLMGGFILYFKFLHILILVPAAAIIYFIILVILKDLGKQEIDLIKNIRIK